jgi:hypothetical protein
MIIVLPETQVKCLIYNKMKENTLYYIQLIYNDKSKFQQEFISFLFYNSLCFLEKNHDFNDNLTSYSLQHLWIVLLYTIEIHDFCHIIEKNVFDVLYSDIQEHIKK